MLISDHLFCWSGGIIVGGLIAVVAGWYTAMVQYRFKRAEEIADSSRKVAEYHLRQSNEFDTQITNQWFKMYDERRLYKDILTAAHAVALLPSGEHIARLRVELNQLAWRGYYQL